MRVRHSLAARAAQHFLFHSARIFFIQSETSAELRRLTIFLVKSFGLIFCSYMDNTTIGIESGWLIIEKCKKNRRWKCESVKSRWKLVEIFECQSENLSHLRKFYHFPFLNFLRFGKPKKSIFNSSPIYLKFLLSYFASVCFMCWCKFHSIWRIFFFDLIEKKSVKIKKICDIFQENDSIRKSQSKEKFERKF